MCHTKTGTASWNSGLPSPPCRKMKGLSQDALAAKAGISRSHLSAIEAPNIIRAFSVEVLYNLADALEIRPGELLDCDIYAYHDAGGTL